MISPGCRNRQHAPDSAKSSAAAKERLFWEILFSTHPNRTAPKAPLASPPCKIGHLLALNFTGNVAHSRCVTKFIHGIQTAHNEIKSEHAQGAYVRLSSGIDSRSLPPTLSWGLGEEVWGEGNGMRDFQAYSFPKKRWFRFFGFTFRCNLLTFVTEFRAFQGCKEELLFGLWPAAVFCFRPPRQPHYGHGNSGFGDPRISRFSH